ncbi:MAG: hypothetical protein JXB23_10430 [Candidatus Aminicenantes bacterium]|nr:hypothetical protein [Candidatus Aminicenantes bacterium]
MKKSFCFLAITFLSSLILYSQEIQVVYPNGGQTLTLGQTYTLQWTSSGIGSQVKIALRKGAAILTPHIDDNAPNTGNYTWTVSNDIEPDSNYKIIISNLDETVYDLSDGHFTISSFGAKPLPPKRKITVLSPNGGENWIRGDTYSIAWNSLNITGHVRIDLYRNNTQWLGPIASSVSNSGSYNWKVPSLENRNKVDMGSNYQVEVASLNYSAVKDRSNGTFALQGIPDLVVCLVKEKWISIPGKRKIQVRVRNVGDRRAGPSTLSILIWLKSTEHYQIPALDPGEDYEVIREEHFLKAGKVRYVAAADCNNNIAESDESNNIGDGWIVKKLGAFVAPPQKLECTGH